jgi:hypothetical protein
MSNKQITEIGIGSDPEVFLFSTIENRIISAIPYIPGSKHEPSPLKELGDHYAIQTDNVMIEFCIPPAYNSNELWNSMNKTVEYINSILPQGMIILIKASSIIDEDQLQHPQALEFGCDSDYNVWSEEVNEKANPNLVPGLRSAGGHVHVSYNDPDMETSMKLVKALDLFLGIPSVILDEDDQRKKLYGKAGAFRFKDYGIEYRSLSNFWITSQELTKFVYDGVHQACNFVSKGIEFTDEDAINIQLAINTNNKELAFQLMHKFKVKVPQAILAFD